MTPHPIAQAAGFAVILCNPFHKLIQFLFQYSQVWCFSFHLLPQPASIPSPRIPRVHLLMMDSQENSQGLEKPLIFRYSAANTMVWVIPFTINLTQ